MNKNSCIIFAFITHLAISIFGETLTDAERGRLQELRSKKPPENRVAAYEKLKRTNEELYTKKARASRDLDVLRNREYVNLKNDVNFLNVRNNHLAEDRKSLLNGFDESQSRAREFNQNLTNMLTERVARSSYTLFRPPVFRAKEVLHAYEPKCLVIDLTNRARHEIAVVGGEIITTGKGKVQFVLLHKGDNGEYSIQTVGEEIEITDEDHVTNIAAYHKSLLFSENFKDMVAGDYFGVLVDGNIGLTYTNVGLSSAVVIKLQDGNLPKSLSSLPEPVDNVKPKPIGKSDAWKRFSSERNVGHTYSFNLYGEIVRGE